MKQTHISIKRLNIAYGSHPALKDISVDIPDRKITAIIGPSGCGKTTLLKSINRIIDLHEDIKVTGSILIDGQDICLPDADILALRKKVGFLPQRPCPLPMSIYDNVAFGPRIHHLTPADILAQLDKQRTNGFTGTHKDALTGQGTSAAPAAATPTFSANPPPTTATQAPATKGKEMDMLVEHYLRLAGLWDEVKDRLHASAAILSIGQQQRLALARVLAIEPEVILADEPTSALDPLSAKLVERQFQLLKKHYTIIIVTHILRQARRIADYVVFMYLGELIEHGPVSAVLERPQKTRTKEYVSGEIS